MTADKLKIFVGKPIQVMSIRQMKEEGPIRAGMLSVAVVTCTNRQQYIDQVFANYLRQNYPNKELCIVLNDENMPMEDWIEKAKPYPAIHVFQLSSQVSLGECFNFGVAQTKSSYVAKFDDDDYYAPHFLNDSLAAAKHMKADIVGKSCRFVYFEIDSTLAIYEGAGENQTVEYVAGATMLIKRDVFKHIRFPDINEGDDSQFQKECLKQGFSIYSADRFNYVTIRRADHNSHTFQMTHEAYLGLCSIIGQTRDYADYCTR